VKTNIPFHQQIVTHTEFIYGQFDTTFVENRFAMQHADREELLKAAAIAATMVADKSLRNSVNTLAQRQGPSRNGWKMAGRREAMAR
jgi:acetyl-CoA carboxylase biotin carboxylase subunit